jgi:predicted nucleic acid-binding Zn ribbon protein
MPVLNEPYQHRAGLACGKRIPRWTEGKAAPASRVYCGNACGNRYRRRAKGRVTKGVAQNVKKRPINRAPFESVYVTEPRPEFPRCKTCGRPYLRASPAERFCSTLCAEFLPLPPRKPDGEWSSLSDRWTIAMVAPSPLRRTSERAFSRLFAGWTGICIAANVVQCALVERRPTTIPRSL